MEQSDAERVLQPQWNAWMIAASVAISLLGAFTSTQLMCQATMTVRFTSVLAWTVLASLTFGFCSIWCLHFVAMLACELDLPIQINVLLTLLSAILAVGFTFAALAFDLLWDRYNRVRNGKGASRRRGRSHRALLTLQDGARKPLLAHAEPVDDNDGNGGSELLSPSVPENMVEEGLEPAEDDEDEHHAYYADPSPPLVSPRAAERLFGGDSAGLSTDQVESERRSGPLAASFQPNWDPSPSHNPDDPSGLHDRVSTSSESGSRVSSTITGSSSSMGLRNITNIAYRSTAPKGNAFIATGEALYAGCTMKNIVKGFLWSLAITSMHYVGIAALKIPRGYLTLHVWFVLLSAVISWIICLVGCILMSKMEAHLAKQILFSIVATTGVAAMHFTGMRAVTFWSEEQPSQVHGYPPALSTVIVIIAITTCFLANGLLAHSATVARNKLAEIVWTRRKLWRAIAQKENAEAAAAARTEFVASASHEIRTPLHHLQGYTDLLSRTQLSEEGRFLLSAIQRSTKTLSLITNNVLDWSKLENDSDALLRPVTVDLRAICESILVLLPNRDDEGEVELMVVVTPKVPHSLFLDETYLHRILMNLLSNALKFTRSGYILLLVDVVDSKLVVKVVDSGPGIPPSFLPRLFDPFTQAQTRGSQRGTGLGLSITKRLLEKMDGTIDVETHHTDMEGVEPGQTGSSFIIKIPIQLPNAIQKEEAVPRIALFHGDDRMLEGLRLAWTSFGFDVAVPRSFDELKFSEWKYIWVDFKYLEKRPQLLHSHLESLKWPILVPYDAADTLQNIPGLLSTPHIIPVQKPLVWHSLQQRVADANLPATKAIATRNVRFAPTVNIVDPADAAHVREERTSKNTVILLVEDNPINQKLGQKMLTSLGYQCLLADDGQDALDQLARNTAIDAVLMDQSMPRKDGVTATREIRAREAAATAGTGVSGVHRRLPIIAVTAVVNTQTQAEFKEAGADAFLAKPLALAKLEQTLAAHVMVR